MKTINLFTKTLIAWFEENARDLPWRKTKDPYKIWISEIMLQQTTVNAVIPYYQKWIKIFPTIDKVANAREEKIFKVWQGLGYYQRVKNIQRSAQIICRELQGQIPRNYDTLRKLPGFGPYTVGAVLSIAYDLKFSIIDANVRRVIMRLFGIKGFADTSQDKIIGSYLDDLLPKKKVGSFNQALMELGAMICSPREPLCSLCPVKKKCVAFSKAIQEIIPQKKKKVVTHINAVVAIIEKKGLYYIQKRPKKGLLANLWEFPGGKIESGEKAIEALKREIQEELNIEIFQVKHFADLVHYYTKFKVNLSVWKCKTKGSLREDRTHRWCLLRDLEKLPMPSGSARIVQKLLKQNT